MKLYNKKVTVFGAGLSGLSALKFLADEGAILSVTSQGEPAKWERRDEVLKLVPPSNCFNEEEGAAILAASELIILSPGIARSHKALEEAHRFGVKIWCEVELAFYFCDVPIIAVTGTNGKTTTVTMISDMLTNSGYCVFVGGNIGRPFCDFANMVDRKKYDFVVLELSSFQLESMGNFRPHVGVFLNLSPSHGERYQNLAEYAQAKFHLADKMSNDDYLIFAKNNALMRDWGKSVQAQKWQVDLEQREAREQELSKSYQLEHFRPMGEHNRWNLYFAIKALEFVDVRGEGIQKTIDEFKGLPNRLERVWGNFPFAAFNDAKSTNWQATIAALSHFDQQGEKSPMALILGGALRGQGDEISDYLKALKERAGHIFLIGESTDTLALELEGEIPCEKSYTLEAVLESCRRDHFSGTLLLSPAFPSFDQFVSYEKRGKCFKDLLQKFWPE